MINFEDALHTDRAVEETLYKVLEGKSLAREEAYRLARCGGLEVQALAQASSLLRNRGKGRRITYSRKVFIPLSNICRNSCAYCSYGKKPKEPEAKILSREEALNIARVGMKAGCTEALLVLGEKPEQYPEVMEWLSKRSYVSMVEYVRDVCKLIVEETGLLPHTNLGIVSKDELVELKEVNASMGMMLENVSERLCIRGGPHEHSPGKHPKLRLEMIDTAGRLKIPFTTGILIGIGETVEEIVDSLYAIKELSERHGHIQEVIIQNFKAKLGTAMERSREPTVEEMVKTIALARLILGEEANIQAPPNLTPREYGRYLQAGINDWGGISPVTIDYVNPESPWPKIREVREVTEGQGFILKARLPIYPEYVVKKKEFLSSYLVERILSLVDEEGLVKEGGAYVG